MSSSSTDGLIYLTKEEIMGIHEDIIESDDDADPGCINEGQIDFTLNFIKHGHYGYVPETIHGKAFSLLRLLSANHSFVDGNKRTALNATWTFYLLNGHYFDYGEEIKAILKLLAVMENMVDQEEAKEHFEGITKPIQDVELDNPVTESSVLLQRIEYLLQEYRDLVNSDDHNARSILLVLRMSENLIDDLEAFIQKYDNREDIESGFNDIINLLRDLQEDIDEVISKIFLELVEESSDDQIEEFLCDMEDDMGKDFRKYVENEFIDDIR
ncbi:type II toxin-antitoxin system death-on-curing family toxin [Natrinema sp. H-ect4]|uniref:type II toxin-antitoxin system death-on-curing family toxin n=1 Tax=Natrinema sp. H-ect4 TaxID=3242699 RepID=UPI0035A915D5